MAMWFLKKYYDKNRIVGNYIFLLFFFSQCYPQLNTPEDCIDAYRICDATQNYYFEVNGIGNVDDANGAMGLYCLGNADLTTFEHNSVWFKFTAQYTGEFGFIICPDITTEDWEWALFGNNPVCGNLANNTYWLRCNVQPPLAVSEGCTGIGFKNGFFWGGGSSGLLAYITIQAGQTYVLYAVCRNFPSNAPSRATLSFQGQVVQDHPDLFNIPGCVMATQNFNTTTASIYPNPFTNTLHIQSETNFKTMALYDVLGKEIINQAFVNELNTGNLAQGVYFLELVDVEGRKVVKKVMKE